MQTVFWTKNPQIIEDTELAGFQISSQFCFFAHKWIIRPLESKWLFLTPVPENASQQPRTG
jgi:hypothetical protein